MSEILGLDAIEKRMASFTKEMATQAGAVLEEQAKLTQRDLVNMLPHHTGAAIETLSRPDAIGLTRNSAGVVVKAEVGLLTAEARKRVFYLFFLEKGRQAANKGGQRRSGKYKSGEQRYKKVTRRVGAIAPRQYFRIAYTLMKQRMGNAMGKSKLKAFAIDNWNNMR